jgi:hypothetical protein
MIGAVERSSRRGVIPGIGQAAGDLGIHRDRIDDNRGARGSIDGPP